MENDSLAHTAGSAEAVHFLSSAGVMDCRRSADMVAQPPLVSFRRRWMSSESHTLCMLDFLPKACTMSLLPPRSSLYETWNG